MKDENLNIELAASALEVAIEDTITELDADALVEVGAIIKGKNHPLVKELARLIDYNLDALETVAVGETI